NAAMAAVIAAMKPAGIAARDLQTAGTQTNPRYTYTNKADGSQEAELVADQVSNTLSVRVRGVDKTGEVLEKAGSFGAN
ncbi:SIMPL domain-containing protein, partial [Mesorhizobium sp. GbtcB19]|uniref:SIMPL domain-containing protein n=1 Tax=Mesorhizobium sp. GbtcB19 TaxID=2824764 RepID=UPI001C2FFCF5